MVSPEKASVPPGQSAEIKKSIEEKISFESVEDAEDMFVIAKERMLDINNWQRFFTGSFPAFQITDNSGHELKRHLHSGDFVRVNFNKDQKKSGIVLNAEAIVYDDFPDLNRESFAMKLTSDSNQYFFIVERIREFVFARFELRNDNAVHEKHANTISFSDEQWRGLLIGFLAAEAG